MILGGDFTMRRSVAPLWGIGLAAALCGVQPLRAQDAPEPAAAATPAIDPSSLQLPDLNFTPDAGAESNYDKYFIFNREETDFATAYADLQECDGYARGLSYRASGGTPYIPYGGVLGGAIGGAIGSAVADAVFGSAERRRMRRVNMRTCMTFKGYRTYGLPKSIWERFNFEEGNARVPEARRQRLLQIQARAASGPRPRVGELVE